MSFSHELMLEILIKIDETDGTYELNPSDFPDYRSIDVIDTAMAILDYDKLASGRSFRDHGGGNLILFERLQLEGADLVKQLKDPKRLKRFSKWLGEKGVTMTVSTAQTLINAWVKELIR